MMKLFPVKETRFPVLHLDQLKAGDPAVNAGHLFQACLSRSSDGVKMECEVAQDLGHWEYFSTLERKESYDS